MKRRKPYDKHNLPIKRGDKVLEIGPGSDPVRRSNVLLEKFIGDNKHRRGDFRIYPHQTVVEGDAQEMPFKDKEFDFVICCHVLEHAEDPAAFLKEVMRVGKRGYIETPSLIGEFLAPKDSHKWLLQEIDNRLVMYEKSRCNYSFDANFGDLFLNYLPYKSLPYRLLKMCENNFMEVKFLWEDTIDFDVNPEDETKDFFSAKWSPEIVKRLFPHVSVGREFLGFTGALFYFMAEKFKSLTTKGRRRPLSYDSYLRHTNDGKKR